MSWRTFPELATLFKPHSSAIAHFETAIPQTVPSFVAESKKTRLPPLVRHLALAPLVVRDGDTEFRPILALTERVLARIFGWTGQRQRTAQRLRKTIMSMDDLEFRGAWAEACFLAWLDERQVQFEPEFDILDSAVARPPKAKLPNVDAHVTESGSPSCWDAKAYSMPAFDTLMFDLKAKFCAIMSELRPELDILFALAHDVARMGSAASPDARTLPAAATQIESALPRFRQWIGTLPDPCPRSPVPSFEVPAAHAGDPPLLTIRVFSSFVPFTFGAQEDEEVAYQLRRKLAQHEWQLHATEPNVRVVVRDSFTPYSVYSRVVWFAALGYLNQDQMASDGRAQFTEGVLALTDPTPLNTLPGTEFSERLHAVVYFDPQAAFSMCDPMIAHFHRAP